MRIKFTKVRTAEIVPLVALFFGVLFCALCIGANKGDPNFWGALLAAVCCTAIGATVVAGLRT